MSSKYSAVIGFVLVALFAGGKAFPLQEAAGQTSPVLADPPSAQLAPVAAVESEKPEPLPEFDPDNPQAIGIILVPQPAFIVGLMTRTRESFLKRPRQQA